MAKYRLTKQTQDFCIIDQELQGKIAKEINRSVSTAIRLAKENDPLLTELSVLEIIAEHTGEDNITNLLQQIPVTA